jgi:murein DD-endopeptidase MepM/ murein hydrolase activator NlpD
MARTRRRAPIGSKAWADEKNKREDNEVTSSGARPKGSGGGRTPGEASLAQNMAIQGNPVSPTNLVVAPSYRAPGLTSSSRPDGKSTLADLLTSVGTPGALELLPEKTTAKPLGTTGAIALKEATDRPVEKLDRMELGKGVNGAPDLGAQIFTKIRDKTGRENLKKTDRGLVVTAIERTKPGKKGSTKRKTFGEPTVKQFTAAAEKGNLKRTRKGQVATVRQLNAAQDLTQTRAAFGAAVKKSKGASRKALMQAGLSPEQAQILSTVLKVGDRLGANEKEKLAAVETALVESNISNPTVATDHDSLGWRQERQMYYPNPTNVRASARRYFQETAAQGKGAGMTAGQLAQAVQRSAYPDKYDERRGEAAPLLRTFNQAPRKAVDPEVRQAFRASKALAVELGVPGAGGRKKGSGGGSGAGGGKYAYPLAAKGELIATPADHMDRAFGNWMSDRAIDISVPVGTPVQAVTDAVVTSISGSAPNHAANPAGWTVYLKDANGEEYSYMHLDGYSVKAGDTVKKGQTIGESGAANGVPHLHFATRGSSPKAVLNGGATGQAKPQYVNFSRKGGPGTSKSKWLVPTGGNEVLKFQRPLAKALLKLAKASGEPIKVNSGFRSYAEQAALYEAYQNGDGNLAAAPGTSNHEGGVAADVELTAKQRELAPQFGLGFPVPGEDWHIELVGAAANQIVSPGSTGGVGGGGPTVPGIPGAPSSETPAEQRQKAAATTYTGSIDSATLPQAYLDLILGGTTAPGSTGLLDEFLKVKR